MFLLSRQQRMSRYVYTRLKWSFPKYIILLINDKSRAEIRDVMPLEPVV